jgi:hypothetical protein
VNVQVKRSSNGIWKAGTRLLVLSVVMLALTAVLAPAISRPVSAAECPPGQKMNAMGVCIAIQVSPNVDIFDVDDDLVINPETAEHLDGLFDEDQGPVADSTQPDVDVNPDGNGESVDFPIGGDPLVDLPEAGSAWLTITKRNCPEGFDAYNADVYELAFECQGIPGTSGFLVSDGGSFVDTEKTDASGNVEFHGLTPGAYSIVDQGVNKHFGEPVVMCESYTPQHPTGQPFEASIDLGNQFLHIFEEDEQLSCSWYNVPVVQ